MEKVLVQSMLHQYLQELHQEEVAFLSQTFLSPSHHPSVEVELHLQDLALELVLLAVEEELEQSS
jgi:hypothetical protein